MSTMTVEFSYANTVTHVTTKMLLTLKEIIREIGLDPSKFAEDWESYELAISTWLDSRHLQRVILEIYSPRTDALVARWDIDIVYASVGGGSLWVDTDAIRYSIAKAGAVPATCHYDIRLTAPGGSRVPGWGSCSLRSTEGFKRYSVGATIGGNDITAKTSYWGR